MLRWNPSDCPVPNGSDPVSPRFSTGQNVFLFNRLLGTGVLELRRDGSRAMTEGPASRTPHNGDASPDAVRAALARVLHSHEFRASRRCQEFLRYVVENTLAGRGDTLKERTIGIDVFGRPASYDPSEEDRKSTRL